MLGLLGLGLTPLTEGWASLELNTTQGPRHALWHAVPGSRWAVHGLEAGPDEAAWLPGAEWRVLALALAEQGYALALWRLPDAEAEGPTGLALRLAWQVGEALGTQAAAWRPHGTLPHGLALPPCPPGYAPLGLGFAP